MAGNCWQFIERDGKTEYAIVPIELWRRLAALAEELDDVALYQEAKAADDGTRVPAEVLHAELDGAHPVRAWREFRQISQEALAVAAGISKAYLCQIETGKRAGSIKTLKSIARSLDVSLDLLQE